MTGVQTCALPISQEVVGSLSNKAKFLETKAQTLQGYDEEDLSSVVNSILNAYPADKDYANVLFNLQAIAAKSGFVITTFALSESESSTKVAQSYSLGLNVSGPRVLFSSFLDEIENSSRIMRVDGLELSTTIDPSTIDASLSIVALYSPAPSSYGAVDSPVPELSSKDQEIIAKLSANSFTQASSGQDEVVVPTGKSNPFE